MIEASLQPLEKQLAIINVAVESLDARSSEIIEHDHTVLTEIKKTFQWLHQSLDTKEEDLISQLDHLS